MKTSRKTAKALEVWRFQRDRIYPDVITGMTKDRKRWVFVTSSHDPKRHRDIVARLTGRTTIYVEAIVGASVHKPTIRIVREIKDW